MPTAEATVPSQLLKVEGDGCSILGAPLCGPVLAKLKTSGSSVRVLSCLCAGPDAAFADSAASTCPAAASENAIAATTPIRAADPATPHPAAQHLPIGPSARPAAAEHAIRPATAIRDIGRCAAGRAPAHCFPPATTAPPALARLRSAAAAATGPTRPFVRALSTAARAPASGAAPAVAAPAAAIRSRALASAPCTAGAAPAALSAAGWRSPSDGPPRYRGHFCGGCVVVYRRSTGRFHSLRVLSRPPRARSNPNDEPRTQHWGCRRRARAHPVLPPASPPCTCRGAVRTRHRGESRRAHSLQAEPGLPPLPPSLSFRGEHRGWSRQVPRGSGWSGKERGAGQGPTGGGRPQGGGRPGGRCHRD